MPAPGMREALFSLGNIRMTEIGRIRMEAATGKTYRIWKTGDLKTWSELTVETLNTPTLDYTDPNPKR